MKKLKYLQPLKLYFLFQQHLTINEKDQVHNTVKSTNRLFGTTPLSRLVQQTPFLLTPLPSQIVGHDMLRITSDRNFKSTVFLQINCVNLRNTFRKTHKK